MTDAITKSPLCDALDKLWRATDGRHDLARRLVGNLPQESYLVLAAWDAAATFGPVGGQLELTFPRSFTVSDQWGKPFFTAELAVSDQECEAIPMLRFSKTPWMVLGKTGNLEPSEHLEHAAVSLLLAMQLIRDHIDSTMLKPREIRDVELDNLALQAGLETDHFRRLSVWFSRIVDVV